MAESLISIVHIIEHFSGAGPTRGILAAINYAKQLGLAQQHTVCTLRTANAPLSVLQAKKAGITLYQGPEGATLHQILQQADVVVVHFWNSPALYAFLRTELPPMRLVIWSRVYGYHAPQVITRELVALADQVLVTAPGTLALPILADAARRSSVSPPRLIYSLLDVTRVDGYQPRPHATFNVGYMGSINFAKMHARYVPMSAGIQLPNVRFIVCGGGIERELAAQAAQLGATARFDFRGYVHAIQPVLEELDVFGYPLCEETYAASELVLQEVMWVGIPPVVFPYGGLATLVQHKQTGLVVHTEREYQHAIEYLYYHPAERQRLGQNARHFAQTTFAYEPTIRQLGAIYRNLAQQPKRQPHWQGTGETPAEWFVQALGDQAGAFATSFYATDLPTVLAAEEHIAHSSPLLQGGEGGVIHYRNYYPEDAYLRLWTALILEAQGKYSQAGQEYQAALALGLDQARVVGYLQRVKDQLKDPLGSRPAEPAQLGR
ncbi:MAG: glycosyltransferase [Caldilineaceae bacterium]|nr:glycosyltransferase [Caldilineaceae bacterium]